MNFKLDQALENILRKFGWRRYASGFSIVDGIRDLAFEKKEDKNAKKNK